MADLEERVKKLEESELKRLDDEIEKLHKKVFELKVEKEISEFSGIARRLRNGNV